ncbi:protein MAIN-LIKE 2-like isoform X2 [Lotus japonicus]|uniref:protein MAIN-LIKE 2-like isoform X2 n=1 Tax=Lotus japonicus TaxID=34305 RepID=UPI0025882610|nr:protein MAIN-LIKE 2-like isoform X2 [Lotus japonicus]
MATDSAFTHGASVVLPTPAVVILFHCENQLIISLEVCCLLRELVMGKSSDMHMNKLCEWSMHERVAKKIEMTCFSQFLKVKECFSKGNFHLPLCPLEALLEVYDKEKCCFRLGKEVKDFLLDMRLEDIYFITGLPIDGIQVSGYVTYEAVDLVMKHLNLKDYQARDLLRKGTGKGAISINKLPLYFKELPSDASDSDVEAHAKAFIMYLFGTTLLPNRKRTIMPDFLEFLDLQKINKYAWGAVVLAHIKNALGNDKKSIYCFTWGLIVFALERFPFIRNAFVLPPIQPVFLTWIDVVYTYFKNKHKKTKVEDYIKLFSRMKEEDVTWNPYGRLALSQDDVNQLRVKYVMVPIICYQTVSLNRPDICFKQLDLEVVNVFAIRKMNIIQPNKYKDINWCLYEGPRKAYNYPELNGMWTNRFSYLVTNLPNGSFERSSSIDDDTHLIKYRKTAINRKRKRPEYEYQVILIVTASITYANFYFPYKFVIGRMMRMMRASVTPSLCHSKVRMMVI